MNVNYNVIVSLITRSKYCTNEEWGILMEAEGFLLSDYIEKWENENQNDVYDIYSKNTSELLRSYLLDKYPEFDELYGMLCTEKDTQKRVALVEAYRSRCGDDYTIEPIPATDTVEKEKTQ